MSSMAISKYLAILNASSMEGLYLPFSREPMVWRETSSAEASSSLSLIHLSYLEQYQTAAEVARQLHVDKSTIGRKLKKYDIISK